MIRLLAYSGLIIRTSCAQGLSPAWICYEGDIRSKAILIMTFMKLASGNEVLKRPLSS